jgi:hypothetical protein
MTRVTNRFTRGTGAYKCRICGRLTRDTGRGDNTHVGLCAECYELAGEENHLSDCGTFYAGAANVLSMIAHVEAKGGNASPWDELKTAAQAELAK